MIGLPARLVARPLVFDDVPAVGALWRACELHDDGMAEVTDVELLADWQRPSFDLATRSLGVLDGDAMVACAALRRPDNVSVCVAPTYRGRGIGTALMRWTWEAARTAGADEIGQTVSENNAAAIALLQAHAYTARRTAWVLAIELEHAPGAPLLPTGYSIRDFMPGRDEHTAHALISDAFAEWSGRTEPFADWVAETLRRPGFTPADLALAVRGDEVAGALGLMGVDAGVWVDQVAVAEQHRGRGLARALLRHAFAVTWRRGDRRCALSTDSRSGALGLYEHVGMAVRRSYTHLVKPL